MNCESVNFMKIEDGELAALAQLGDGVKRKENKKWVMRDPGRVSPFRSFWFWT